MAALGAHIKLLRKKQQLSQSQLSKKSGIKREYISSLERGKLRNPTLNTLSKIARGLGVPLEKLLLCDSADPHSFQDLLEKSSDIEQKISLLKDDLQKMTKLLDSLEEKPDVLLLPGSAANFPITI